MPINPIISARPRFGRGGEAEETTRSQRTSGSHQRTTDARTDQVSISTEARALSGDSSLGADSLAKLQELALQTLDQLRQSEEQASLVRSVLGFGS